MLIIIIIILMKKAHSTFIQGNNLSNPHDALRNESKDVIYHITSTGYYTAISPSPINTTEVRELKSIHS